MGKNPEEEVLPSGLPSLVRSGQTLYFCLSTWPAASPCHAGSGPPTGWAGWGRGWVPFGRRQRVTVWFPAFSSRQQTTSPARPSWWAGHEALVLEPQARPQFDQLPSPIPPTREWGSKGKEPPSPWCSFPYFFKEIGPRLGSQSSLPFQRQ